jgi:predicted acetyltransferase
MPSVRALTPADVPAYAAIAGYAYNLTPERTCFYLTPPYAGRMLGIFTEDKLAAALMEFPFDVWLLGRAVKAVGVATIASAPETRRTGRVRDLLAGHLGRLRDEGVALSLLYPFSFGFYERLGWSLAAQRVEIRVPPAEFAAYGRRAGRLRQILYAEKGSLQPADGETLGSVVAILNRVYEPEAIRFNLTALRTEEHWRDRVLSVDEGRRFVFIWEDDAGQPQGHVITRVAEEVDMAPLIIRELVAATPSGWRGLFFFLGCHQSQHKYVRFVLPAGSPLLDLFGNPRLEESSVSPGVMARIVDVKNLLETRGVPDAETPDGGGPNGEAPDREAPDGGGSGRGSCVIRVVDTLAPWNDGVFAVTAKAGKVTVRKAPGTSFAAGSCDATAWTPDLEIDIGILSRVAVGTRSLREVLRFGLATGRPGPGLEFAQRFFPERPIWHPEYY